MGIQFNKGQRQLLVEAVKWYKQGNEQVFQYSGGPGTGKSLMMNAILDTLGINRANFAPMSFMGAAAIVMRTKGMLNAKTIHSWLYMPIQVPIMENGKPKLDPKYQTPLYKTDWIPRDFSNIEMCGVDEGGMVPLAIKGDLESRNKPIIVSGDIDQLPPVKDKPAYLYSGKIFRLTEVMRQAEGSGIVYISRRIRDNLPINNGFYGDCLVIDRDDLRDYMLLNADMVLCGKNNTRDWANKHVRENIIGYRRDIPYFGEKVICKKNNWEREVDGINLANGLSGTVTNNPDPSTFDPKRKTFRMDFKPNFMDIVFDNLECDYEYFTSENKDRAQLKNNKYSFGDKFEFAYCCTVHSSQGSQWNTGVYLQEYLNPSINSKLDYTAITRFKKGCIFVRQPVKTYY